MRAPTQHATARRATPQEGGARVVAACVGEAEGRLNGQLLSRRAVVEPTGAGADASLAARLWGVSCAALGLPADEGSFGAAAQPAS